MLLKYSLHLFQARPGVPGLAKGKPTQTQVCFSRCKSPKSSLSTLLLRLENTLLLIVGLGA